VTDRVRVGVIGTGSLGTRHARTVAERVPKAALVAVTDERRDVAEVAATLSPETVHVPGHPTLLSDPAIDAVVITTPNDTHVEMICAAARAGKHIFCEKPIALDLAGANAALAAVSEAGVKLQVGFQRRFDGAYRAARDKLRSGKLGEIELVVATTRDPSPPPAVYFERCGSFFADTSIHDYDVLRFLTGLEVAEVHAVAATFAVEDIGTLATLDTAVTTIRLENGALATITNSRRSNYGYDVRIEVAGSKGKVAVGEHQQSRFETLTDRGATRDFVGSYWDLFEQAYVAEIQHFVDCVANDTEPEATGHDALRALEIAVLAERSYTEGRPVAASKLR